MNSGSKFWPSCAQAGQIPAIYPLRLGAALKAVDDKAKIAPTFQGEDAQVEMLPAAGGIMEFLYRIADADNLRIFPPIARDGELVHHLVDEGPKDRVLSARQVIMPRLQTAFCCYT